MSRCAPTEYRRLRPHLGTFVEVRVGGLKELAALRAIERAYDAITLVERRMSAHDPTSDLGHLYRCAGGSAIVHPWTYQVLAAALWLQRLSGGVFDITVGERLVRDGSLPLWQARCGCDAKRAGSSLQLLGNPRARLRWPVRLDLGGIAKGFAVDRAIDALRHAGARSAAVNAGGDLRLFGPRCETLLLRAPKEPTRLWRVATISNCAAATSASYFSPGGENQSRLFDGRTWQQTSLPESYTVISRECLWADALTKIVAANGLHCGPLLKRFGARALVLSGTEGSAEVAEVKAVGGRW